MTTITKLGALSTVALIGLCIPTNGKTFDFGRVPIGTTSPSQMVTLIQVLPSGAGFVRFRIDSINGDFIITGGTGTCPAIGLQINLFPGDSCTVAVAFKPTAIGTRTGKLSYTIESSLSSVQKLEEDFTGYGETQPPASSKSASTFVCLGQPCSIARVSRTTQGEYVTQTGKFGSAADMALLEADAAGESGFGVLRARASAKFDVTGTAKVAYVGGSASFFDWMKIDYAPWNGRQGLIWFRYTLDGTAVRSGRAEAFAQVTLQVGPTTPSKPFGERWTNTHRSAAGVHAFPRSFPFTYGQWFPIYFWLDAFAGSTLPTEGGYSPIALVGTGSGSSNFENTFALESVSVTDLNGTPAPSPALTSTGDANYIVTPPTQCTYVFDPPSSANFGAQGGTGTVRLKALGTSCTWTGSSNAPWTQIYPLSGIESGTVQFSVFPNFSSNSRAAVLTLAGQQVPVEQAGNTGTLAQRFVDLLYFNFLGRLPRTDEMAGQVAALNTGTTRGQLVLNFFNSPEFNLGGRFIAGLYVGLLNRDAEYSGWLFQRQALARSIVNHDQLVSNFLNSQEFDLKFGALTNAQFIALMYENILLRPAGQPEINAWLNVMSNPANTRTVIARSFLRSPEFEQGTGPRLLAFLLYSTLLLRDGTPSERTALETQLANPAQLPVLIDQLANGSEINALLQ